MKFPNKFTLAILLFLVGLLSIGLKTQKAIAGTRTIKVCNSSSENIDFALAWQHHSGGGDGFGWFVFHYVQGWYNLNPGQCDNYTVDAGSLRGIVWIYGKSKNHEYPRQSVFVSKERNLLCIHPSLRFLYSDRSRQKNEVDPGAKYNPSTQRWYCEGDSQAEVRKFIRLDSDNFSFIPNSSNLISSKPTPPPPTPPSPPPQQSKTSINYCNRTSEPIYAAYAAYDQNNGWQSKGWYKVEPQQCRDVSLGKVYKGNVYVYGIQGTGYWGKGDASLCIDQKDAFAIRHSDTDTCSGGNFKKVPMTRLSVNPGQNNWNMDSNTTPTPHPTPDAKDCLVKIGGHCILP